MSIIRDITIQAHKYLEAPETLLFVGARQAGKTTVLKQLEAHVQSLGGRSYFLNLEDPDYLALLNQSPKNLFKIFAFDLQTKTHIFIDEIQYLKNPSNFLKYFYDEYKEKIKIIASGSSAFYIDRKFKDSLAGRKKILFVRTLSFREFLRFKRDDRLASLDFYNLSVVDREKILNHYEEYITFGGYPRVVLSSLADKKDVLQEIAYSYIKKDVHEAHIRQDDIFFKLFKILASGIGNLVNASELAATLGVSKTSINNYFYVMQKSFHIHLAKPFYKNIRKELTKMPKIYFYDLGLRNFFINNFNLFITRDDKGGLLENAVWRQLIGKYSEDEIKFWRTIYGSEVDFVVNDQFALEVKVSPEQFQRKKYKAFTEAYPRIPMKIVAFDTDVKKIDGLEAVSAWTL